MTELCCDWLKEETFLVSYFLNLDLLFEFFSLVVFVITNSGSRFCFFIKNVIKHFVCLRFNFSTNFQLLQYFFQNCVHFGFYFQFFIVIHDIHTTLNIMFMQKSAIHSIWTTSILLWFSWIGRTYPSPQRNIS